MYSVIRNVLRSPALKSCAVARTNSMSVNSNFVRTFSLMSKRLEAPLLTSVGQHGQACTCGCNVKFLHTKAERELVEFLNEEITTEKQQTKKVPTELDGFKVAYDGSEVELTKQTDKEKVVITFNVNHTVDAEDEEAGELNPNADGRDTDAVMRSKPNFDVDIVKGDTTLCLSCSFLKNPPVENEYDDVFGIEEIIVYKGEIKENHYACAGDVLDGYLYDLLMNVLEEKGVTNEFVYKLSDLSTAYEHSSYVQFLQSLSKFVSDK